jgi:hypothetical protein
VLQFYGALAGRGAAGKFSKEQSLFSAIAILLMAWTSALRSLPKIMKQRRAMRAVRRISRLETYRLLRTFRISAAEVALKD